MKQKLKMTKTTAVTIVLALIAAGIFGVKIFQNLQKPALEFQKGIGYVSWSKEGYLGADSDRSLEAAAKTGANWVSILVTWYQSNTRSFDIKRTRFTPSDEAVIHAVRKAHDLGMKVMFKLHLDLLDESDGSWRGEIGCVREEDWEKWFANYTEFIMYYVRMAKREKVEMVCVGTELSTTATTKGYMWRDLIKKVRSQYRGALTYAAHWDRYMDIRFWDMLDYVGINAYFPLSEKASPSYKEIKAAWQKWVKEMEDFQKKVNKPIIFPESGCNSCDGALIRPWEHAPRREVNLRLQEDDYRLLVEIFYEKKWFYGMYWWYWGTHPNMGGQYNRGFSPQNKPAEKVIKEAYARPMFR